MTTRNWRGIGWRVAVLRQLSNLCQTEAAKLAGITLKTWRNVESGKPCQTGTLFAIAMAFGTGDRYRVQSLAGGTGPAA